MNFLERYLIERKLSHQHKAIFKEIMNNVDVCENLYDKLDEKRQIEFSNVFIGIAYELFIINLYDLGLKFFKRLHFSNLQNMVSKMENSDQQMVVMLVVYNSIKNDSEIKDNYFFKIFESELKNTQLSYPKNEMYHFPKFREAWYSLYNEIIIPIEN